MTTMFDTMKKPVKAKEQESINYHICMILHAF